MARRQVKCIRKPGTRMNPHQRITHLGGDWGYNGAREVITEDQAIRDIQNHTHTYHVSVGFRDADVFISHHNGNPYLRTVTDDTTVDNLLSLPTCY